jgi:hypothetical protein
VNNEAIRIRVVDDGGVWCAWLRRGNPDQHQQCKEQSSHIVQMITVCGQYIGLPEMFQPPASLIRVWAARNPHPGCGGEVRAAFHLAKNSAGWLPHSVPTNRTGRCLRDRRGPASMPRWA